MTSGSGRSGTTLVNMVLGGHPRGAALGEVKSLPARLAGPDPTPCRSCDDDCHVWSRDFAEGLVRRHWPGHGGAGDRIARHPLARRARRTLGLRPDNLFDAVFRRSGADVLFDSSKGADWVEGRMGEVRRDGVATPFFVFVTRDGRAVLHSFRRRQPDVPAQVQIDRWTRQMAQFERIYDRMPPSQRLRVSYEALTRDPEGQTRRICDALGLDYDPAMLRYWEHEHHALGGNKGTHLLVHRSRGTDLEANPRLLPDRRRREHYLAHGLAIREDDRWRRDIDPDDLALFERVAGSANAPYADPGA